MTPNGKPKILIAEDDADDRLLIHDALEEAGLNGHVTFVNDGVELLDCLYGKGKTGQGSPLRPDFILLDLKMPRKNGWEALDEIRRDPALKSLLVFILTTSTDDDDRQHARQRGANGYFTKQVTFDGLVDEIRRIGRAWERLKYA
jgi:two-component system response regulator